MSGRIETHGDPQAAVAGTPPLQIPPPLVAPVEAVDPDERWGNGASLPNDHPAWMRDALSISQRARALLAKLQPVVVRVVAFWEHRVKSIAVGGRTLSVDSSGSYRCD